MRLTFFTFLCALFLATAGCTPEPSDVCEPLCECEGCSTFEFDNCVDDYLDDESEASRKDCLDLFDDYNECREETWVCRDGDWDTDCRRERDRLRNCLDG